MRTLAFLTLMILTGCVTPHEFKLVRLPVYEATGGDGAIAAGSPKTCLLYTSPSPRD